MIVTRLDRFLLVVQQADHARLAADLLSLLRDPELIGHPRRGRLLRAVAEHDNGWWEADSAPRRSSVDPSAPLDFRELPEGERAEVWRRGVERHAASEPYVAAMIAAHGHRLLAAREAAAPRAGIAEELALRRDELAKEAGVAGEELAADSAWLTLADELALAAATGDPRFVRRGFRAGAEAAPDALRLRLTPFPLAGSSTLALSCRLLSPRPFASDAELAVALARLPWLRLPVRVVPMQP